MNALGVLLCYALAACVVALCIAFVVMARSIERGEKVDFKAH